MTYFEVLLNPKYRSNLSITMYYPPYSLFMHIIYILVREKEMSKSTFIFVAVQVSSNSLKISRLILSKNLARAS